jgi:hypothetical protein
MVTTQLAAGMDQGVHPVHVFGDEAFSAIWAMVASMTMMVMIITATSRAEGAGAEGGARTHTVARRGIE